MRDEVSFLDHLYMYEANAATKWQRLQDHPSIIIAKRGGNSSLILLSTCVGDNINGFDASF